MTRKAKKSLTSKIQNNLNIYLRRVSVVCAVLILAISFAQSANAATYSVTTTADNGDDTNPTSGSLRAAIITANATPAADTINFSVSGTISPPTSLPAITQPLIINGYSATGSAAATSSVPATLVVELNGANAGESGIGLQFSVTSGTCTTTNCRVLGLAINRFMSAGIRINNGSVGILGNFVGTDINGTSNICGTNPTVLCGNINRGILIVGATGNAIGNSTTSNRNIISANLGTGISITGGGSATVANNFIGTDKNGTADLGNSQDGVRIVDSSASTIGGGTSASRNIISGNDGNGVSVIQSSNTTSATTNTISANFIGVDVNGNTATLSGGFSTSPVGNSGSGVLISAAGNTVGGLRTTTSANTCSSACNVISGNRANGVSVSSNFATGNIVSGNNIGVGLDSTTVIGNRDNGIQISNLASGNTTGGTTLTAGFCNNTCNIIANNGDVNSSSARAGIYIDPTAAAANAIRGNSIYNNGNPPSGNPANGLGIDLGDIGTTANDSKDPDIGANNLQNFPVITSANTTGAVQGALNSTANSTFAIDFYSNSSTDGSSSEGRTYLGSISATTDANGNTPTFTFNATTTLTVGQFITATATSVSGSVQAVGDTSEFSAAQAVMTTTAAFGYEGDVSPRPSGDNFVDSDDIQQIRRFSVGLDKPYTSNEFQRADDSPRSTSPTGSGDGYVDSDDVQQARRYAVGTDAKQTASGPITEATPTPTFANSFVSSGKSIMNLKNAPVAGRAVRIVSQNTSAGQTVTVPINVDTTGDEAGYTFSISFDQTKLTATNVTIGNLGGDVLFNINNTDGTIGFSVTSFSGGTIAAVNNGTLVNVTFTVAANATPGTTNINFTDNPARRKVSGTDPNTPLPQPTFTNGTVTITGPTAATTTISGRILSAEGIGLANATVSLLDAKTGQTMTATSNEEGYYNFGNIEVGKDYIISPSVKGYAFSPASKYFSLIDGLTDVDFKAMRKNKVRFNK